METHRHSPPALGPHLQRADLFLRQVVGRGTLGPQALQAGDADVDHVLHQLALLQGCLRAEMLLLLASGHLLVHSFEQCFLISSFALQQKKIQKEKCMKRKKKN